MDYIEIDNMSGILMEIQYRRRIKFYFFENGSLEKCLDTFNLNGFIEFYYLLLLFTK